jgi:chaperonin cofactor prefoldin
MAARQEESLSVSTNNVQIRLNNLNDMAERAESYAMVVGRAMVKTSLLQHYGQGTNQSQEHLSSRLEVLADQQEDMGKVCFNF